MTVICAPESSRGRCAECLLGGHGRPQRDKPGCEISIFRHRPTRRPMLKLQGLACGSHGAARLRSALDKDWEQVSARVGSTHPTDGILQLAASMPAIIRSERRRRRERGNSLPSRNQTGRSMSGQRDRAAASVGVPADAVGEGPLSPARAPARMLGKA